LEEVDSGDDSSVYDSAYTHSSGDSTNGDDSDD
jgi:hypothetical protein